MNGRIYRELSPVRRRQRGLAALRAMVMGILIGSVALIVLGLWRLSGGPVSPAMAITLLAAGPLIGLIAGFWRGRSWDRAASAVDAHYALKDRTVTALAFLKRPERSTLQELQVEDALAHLGKIAPREVVPMKWPRTLPYAVAALMLALGLLAWPLASRDVKAGPAERHPVIEATAEKVIADLKQLDELTRSERDPELEKLVDALLKKAEEMKEPGVDEREALAKLSEMQSAIAAQQAQYNVGLVDGQLQALGAAMSPASALEAAGNAMQDAKFDEAAEELEKLEAPELERKEAKAVEEKLKQVASTMGDVGLGQLSAAASELAEGVKDGHNSKMKKAARALAALTRDHNRRRKIDRLLEAEFDRLSECKSQCQSNSLVRGRNPKKSTNSSQSFGLSTSGNVIGEKTDLLSKRTIEQVTGTSSDEGDSEVETTHSPEGRQRASRGYRESYEKALARSEAVLDSEPIPLGHRQTIRRYFELIRPRNVDGSESAGSDSSGVP